MPNTPRNDQPTLHPKEGDRTRGVFGGARRLSPITLDEYLANTEKRRSIERIIEIIVQCSVDLNHALLFESWFPAPGTYYESFMNLIQAGIVPASLAKKLASAAGLRNRLAHEYDEIDDSIVHANITHILRDFPPYLASVQQKIDGWTQEATEKE